MASYAVHMRIEGVRPTRPGGALRRPSTTAGGPPAATTDTDLAPMDLVGRPPGEVLAERWLRIREAWGQTTFFLFDPDSWR